MASLVTSTQVKLITALGISVILNIGLLIHALTPPPVDNTTDKVVDELLAKHRKERNELLQQLVERDIRIHASRQREDSIMQSIPNIIEQKLKQENDKVKDIPDTMLLDVVHDILKDE